MKALQTLVIAAALATAGAAAAQQWQPDPKAPYDVQADDSRLDDSKCTAVLTGNVRVTQGRARLLSKSAVMHSGKKGGKCGQPSRIDLDGNVFYITPDGRVRSNKAVYDLDKDQVLFTGDVVLIRGEDVSTSQRLTVSLKDNTAVMEGGFRALIMPPKDAK